MKLRFKEDDHLAKVTQQERAELYSNSEFRSITASLSFKTMKNLTHRVGSEAYRESRVGMKSTGIRRDRFMFWLCDFLTV